MAFKIYTKTGDKGMTGLIGGTRVSKSDPRIEACGTIDELNSYIGLIADVLDEEKSFLRNIQKDLFVLGAIISRDSTKKNAPSIPTLDLGKISLLETEIDNMENVLPVMTHFILPGGHPTISHIHIARSIARRAERCTILVLDQQTFLPTAVLQYLNRLSDYLFVLARYIGQKLGVEEIKWIPET